MPDPKTPPTDLAGLHAAAVQTTEHAIKVASALRDQLAKAPKAPAAELCKEAAAALIEHQWTTQRDPEEVARLLADPTCALSTLVQVVKKASEALTAVAGDPRLAAGNAIPPAGTKQASQTGTSPWGAGPAAPDSEADRAFEQRILAARTAGAR